MFVAWSAGACLYCAPEGGVAGMAEFIRRHGLTFWLSVPSTVAFMRADAHAEARQLSDVAMEPVLRRSLCRWAWREPGKTLHRTRPSRTSTARPKRRSPSPPIVCRRSRLPTLDALQTVPIGRPLPGQQVIVVDEDGNPAPRWRGGRALPRWLAGGWRLLARGRANRANGSDRPGAPMRRRRAGTARAIWRS